ncbi:MAG: tryptophan synthase subunit alpha [Magnetococcales bacterium]|nr:tryptophan synthase subunit alpha [Magnetococcales bacterium]
MSGALEGEIRRRLAARRAAGRVPALLMSHLVMGYPSLEENARVIDAMAAAGVELMELQIPFSEPSADGPVIARANQQALDGGFKVDQGMAFAAEMIRRHPGVKFLLMTYYNIVFARGEERFLRQTAALGAAGVIVPDLPLQYAAPALDLCRELGLSWVQLMTPTSRDERLAEVGRAADGLVYCVARRGVTGQQSRFGEELREFIGRCRQATDQPLAVGFGVKRREDVAILAELAEIAVVGTAAIEVHLKEGAAGVERFFRGLREDG